MKPLTVHSDPENLVPHVLYDLTIADVEERRRKATRLESARHVSTFLGIDPRKVFFNRLPGTRVWSPFLQKHFAIRIAKNQS